MLATVQRFVRDDYKTTKNDETMENEQEKQETTCGCGCEGAEKPGKSQKMANDQTTENDIIGASNYERAESDQSKGIFAQQTETYNRVMEEIQENDDQNAKDNSFNYMDELKEESEALGDNPKPYGDTEDSPDFPSEGKFTPPY